jgi:multiple sugar transport system permease protein
MSLVTGRRRASNGGLRPPIMAPVCIAIFFLAPFVITLLASLRHGTEARLPPLPPWPTTGISFDSYRSLDSFGAGIWQHTVNSLIVSVATVVLTVAISLLAGYGFSRYRFPFKNVFFVLIIATLMIPFQSILTPLFIILAKLGLNNSLFGLTLVYVTLQLPFSVFMMRNAFDAVPKEIEEAARIDGAQDMKLLVMVLLPLVLPGVATVAIFAFLNAWNEFLAALVLLSSNEKVHAAGADDGGARRSSRSHQLGRGAGGRRRNDHPLPHRLPASATLLHARAHGRRSEMTSQEKIGWTTMTKLKRDRQFRPLPVPNVDVHGLFGDRQDAICDSTAETLLDRCVEAGMVRAIDVRSSRAPASSFRSGLGRLDADVLGQRPRQVDRDGGLFALSRPTRSPRGARR